MKKSTLFRSVTVFTFLISAGAGRAVSQVMITADDFRAVMENSQRMEYSIEYYPNPSVDLGTDTAGARSFDFSAVPNESTRDSALRIFIDPAGEPGEEDFPGATLCTPQTVNPTDSSEITLVGFYLLRPDGFYLMGNYIRQVVSTLMDTTVVQRYTPMKLLIPLPLGYGVHRAGTDTIMIDSSNNDYSVTMTTVECDGWGEVTLPAAPGATSFAGAGSLSCLRLKTTEIEELYFDGSFGEREKRVTVSYITPEGVLVTVRQDDSNYVEGIAAVTGIEFSMRVGTTGIRRLPGGLPRTLMLSQNYPNPFNPSTTIAFSLPTSGRARLEVFDMLGRSVSTPVEREMPPGSYTLPFDGGSLPSGTYVYRLTAGGISASKKMNIVK